MTVRLPVGLRIYRLLSAAAGPFAPILLARRAKHGKESRQRLPERRGESRLARPDGALVWLHGASVGELLSVLPLIERIRARGLSMIFFFRAWCATPLLTRGMLHQITIAH